MLIKKQCNAIAPEIGFVPPKRLKTLRLVPAALARPSDLNHLGRKLGSFRQTPMPVPGAVIRAIVLFLTPVGGLLHHGDRPPGQRKQYSDTPAIWSSGNRSLKILPFDAV
jgi:hypothetical protein